MDYCQRRFQYMLQNIDKQQQQQQQAGTTQNTYTKFKLVRSKRCADTLFCHKLTQAKNEKAIAIKSYAQYKKTSVLGIDFECFN